MRPLEMGPAKVCPLELGPLRKALRDWALQFGPFEVGLARSASRREASRAKLALNQHQQGRHGLIERLWHRALRIKLSIGFFQLVASKREGFLEHGDKCLAE